MVAIIFCLLVRSYVSKLPGLDCRTVAGFALAAGRTSAAGFALAAGFASPAGFASVDGFASDSFDAAAEFESMQIEGGSNIIEDITRRLDRVRIGSLRWDWKTI